ncbi:NfeD family protein [Plastoroseomonas arctica]|uniref:NfeD family protein n=1 Tax=Plastoroseomonas arctica TaxID=1509237 RepID=A0AAF1JZQ9_9PROT|nr:NfeD family protein [Plastoroseomonas arctica]MBR0656048.1 NfeD family protein [Plastoroseomonas arctica]
MDPGLIWILAGVLMLFGELLLPGIFLLWIGLATIATGLLVMLLEPTFGSTVLMFNMLLLAGVFMGIKFRPKTRGHPAVNMANSGLVGRSGLVISADSVGIRVRIGDSDWPARLPRDVERTAEGATVRVEAVDGMTLVVRPVGA